MGAIGGALQAPIEQVENPPPEGTKTVDGHNDWSGPGWLDPIPRSHNQWMWRGDAMMHAKAQSHATDHHARWTEGGGAGPPETDTFVFETITQLEHTTWQ